MAITPNGSADLGNKFNAHVDRLGRYMPFSPSHDQIWEEYQRTQDALNLETAAFRYVLEAVRSGARFVVLTGDAGHGKTHLCRRVLEKALGHTPDQARRILIEQCDGTHVLNNLESVPACSLRIHKDLSEPRVDAAAQWIETISASSRETTIVCANEGRLRAVLGSTSGGENCAKLKDAFEAAFMTGQATRDGRVHVVNLNHQSVAAQDPARKRSLAQEAIREWTSGTRWRVCGECKSRPSCPIYLNRELLAQSADVASASRADKLELLLGTLERLGVVITIRDLLMTLAYLLTGGLRCRDVHKRVEANPRGWQHEYAFYNVAFAPPQTVREARLQRMPLLSHLARLDPGKRALKPLDDRIVNQNDAFSTGQLDLQFKSPAANEIIDASNGIDDIIGNPRNRTDRQKEAEFVRTVVRCLRRRAWFDSGLNAEANMESLGFTSGSQFLAIVSGRLEPAPFAKLKRQVIAGLHYLQGMQVSQLEPHLDLVDPAFAGHAAAASILADKIPGNRIALISLKTKWHETVPPNARLVDESVDWLDRHVVLRITGSGGGHSDVMLDLLMFECIIRASRGHVASKFYESELRRILAYLGKVAQSARADPESITILSGGVRQSINIDGPLIHVGTGA